MAQAYVPIQTYTLTSNASSITFSNIPQNYTDLLLRFSARSSNAGTQSQFKIRFNSDSGSNYIRREIAGYGSTVNSFNATTTAFEYIYISANTGTSSTFSNGEAYIPNYTGSSSKSFSINNVQENNDSTNNYLALMAGRWTGTAAVTTIELIEQNSGNFVSGSTFTLYGIGGARASGGTITADAQYTYHTFTSSGTFTALEKIKGAEILCIAGGGGGGNCNAANEGAGGGGAGGLSYRYSQLLNSGSSYAIIVGSGGAGGTNGPSGGTGNKGTSGSNSLFASISATGGGGGGADRGNASGISGGSGGGAGYSGSAGTGTVSQGNDGGVESSGRGGGGGGAASVGSSGTTSGDGGAGSSTYSSWGYATSTGALSGGVYYYAGGGGGGGARTGSYTAGGNGGLGGGGAGGSSATAGSAATANTGGGGGGAGGNNFATGYVGGNGGSGLVIIRYPN